MTTITERLRADLDLAAQTLRRYEALHRAKGTPESTHKAEFNASLARRFEDTLADQMPPLDHNWRTGAPAASLEAINAWWARHLQPPLDWSDAPLPANAQPDSAMIMPRPTWYPADAVDRMIDTMSDDAKTFGLEVVINEMTGRIGLRRIDAASACVHAEPSSNTLQLWTATRMAHPHTDPGDNVAFYRALEHFRRAVSSAGDAEMPVIGEIRFSDTFGRYAFLARSAFVLVGDKIIRRTDAQAALAQRDARLATLEKLMASDRDCIADLERQIAHAALPQMGAEVLATTVNLQQERIAELEAQRVPLEDVPFLIHYDDADRQPEVVVGEDAARAVFARIGDNWNAHLFVKVASNTRDDQLYDKNATLATGKPCAGASHEPTPTDQDRAHMGWGDGAQLPDQLAASEAAEPAGDDDDHA